MKLKRVVISCVLLVLFTVSAYADMGPKPSVTLKFRDFQNGEFYATLLTNSDYYSGPWSQVTEEDAPPTGNGIPEGYVDAWLAFAEYEDPDGYYFQGFVQKPERHTDREGEYLLFSWDYYPPVDFKLLIYFPYADQCFVCDESMETYAFHSQYEVTHSEPDEFRLYIDRSYGYGWEVFAFLVRLCLTIAFEILVALMFGFKQKGQLQVILLANLVTQLALNLGLLTHEYPTIFFFYVVEYFIWEALIFGAEAITYKLTLHRFEAPYQPKKRPILYALSANIVSFIMGYVIWQWFPNVF